MLLPFFFFSSLQGQEIIIKSLQVYSGTDQLSLPVAVTSNNSPRNITIEFDINAEKEPNLVIEFRFCNIDWEPYENLFLSNKGKNVSQTLWFDDIKTPHCNADFHYKGSFPNADITFPFPGKWVFYIRDSMYKDEIFAQGCFFVVNSTIPIKTKVTKELIDGPITTPVELGRIFSFDVNFSLPDSLFPSNVTAVEIIENRKYLSPVQLDRYTNGLHNFYTDGGHSFTFNAKDIHPGNGYRKLDITRASYPDANAQYSGFETSGFNNFRQHDLVGGSIIMNYRSENAQYINVTFRLKAPDNLKRKVFLTGAFTDWLVLPEYEMIKEEGFYTIDVELKRGEYDYSYVLGDIVNDEVENIDWYSLEGNFWETDNDYHIFVYYLVSDYGGYNKIIGYKKIRSGNL